MTESLLHSFSLKKIFLVLRRALPLVGNDASDGRRNSGIARRATRFRSFVQSFLPFFHPGLWRGF